MGIGMVQHFQDSKGEAYTICFEDGKEYTADPSWKFIGEAHSQNSFCDVCRNYDQTYVVPTSDPVNRPDHYTAGGIETIDFLQAKLGDGFEHYLVGNIIKYITRYRHKNGVEDLKKAQWYLTKLIEVKSNENS